MAEVAPNEAKFVTYDLTKQKAVYLDSRPGQPPEPPQESTPAGEPQGADAPAVRGPIRPDTSGNGGD